MIDNVVGTYKHRHTSVQTETYQDCVETITYTCMTDRLQIDYCMHDGQITTCMTDRLLHA